jgi:ABC-type transport system involved in multi-copper enzyme maturation permease subunit
MSNRGIPWKEWREKRWEWAGIALVMILAPILGPFMVSTIDPYYLTGDPRDLEEIAFYPLIVLALSPIFLSVLLFSSRELDPATGFLYTLPVSRSRILIEKIRSLFYSWVLLVLIFLVVVTLVVAGSGLNDPRIAIGVFVTILLWCLPALMLGMIFRFHFRSVLVALIVTAFFSAVLAAIIALTSGGLRHDFWEIAPGFSQVWMCIAATLALGGWLFYLYCKTPIMEMGGTARVLLGLLFGIAMAELAFTFFWCDYRDLVFIVLGI